MPQRTIYLPEYLDDDVRRFGVPISATCQKALAAEVEEILRKGKRAEAGVHQAAYARAKREGRYD